MKKFFGYAAFTLCSLVFFLAILFPADQAATFVETRLSKALNMDVSMSRIAPTGLFKVRLDTPGVRDKDGFLVRAQKVVMSAGPLSILRKRPNVDLTALAYGGDVDGHFEVSENAKGPNGPYDGWVAFRGVKVESMEITSRIPEPGMMTGTLSGEFNFSNLSQRWMDMQGEGNFTLASGTLVMWSGLVAGMTVPYDEMHMLLSMGNRKIDIKECIIKGDLVRGRFSGTIKLANKVSQSRVSIKGTMEPTRTFYESDMGKLAKTVFRNKKPGDPIPFTVSGSLDDMQFVPK